MDCDVAYYSPYKSPIDEKITIICWVKDEVFDYNSSGFFIKDDEDNICFAEDNVDVDSIIKFRNEDHAIKWMFKHIKPEMINDWYGEIDNGINKYLK